MGSSDRIDPIDTAALEPLCQLGPSPCDSTIRRMAVNVTACETKRPLELSSSTSCSSTRVQKSQRSRNPSTRSLF
jgi:hypothetical protein